MGEQNCVLRGGSAGGWGGPAQYGLGLHRRTARKTGGK